MIEPSAAHRPGRDTAATRQAGSPQPGPRDAAAPGPRRAAGVRLCLAAAPLTALVAVLALTIRHQGLDTGRPRDLYGWYAAAWTLFAASVWALRSVPARHTAALVLAGGIAVAATGLLGPPRTSSDSYRYAWDGRVQASGTSPYDHAPADPALAPLRDDWLFPPDPGCRAPGFVHHERGVCTRINRPHVHTIYPPVAEGWFLAVHALSPSGARHKPLQAGGAVLAVGTAAVLLYAARRRGAAAWPAALWAWCPAVPVEAVNNAHVDTLGILLAVLALGTARRATARGALLGAATAAKLLPAVVLPGALSGLLRRGGSARAAARESARVLLPAAAVLGLAYLPYVLLSDSSVLGYLGGYTEEEGYTDPSVKNRYALLRLVLPDAWAFPAVLAVLAAVCLGVLRRGDPDRPWRGALVVTGAAFLLLTPGYPWYALLVVALAAFEGRWEWLGIPVAGTVPYLAGPSGLDREATGTAAYAGALALLVAGLALRARASGRAER